MHIFIMYKWGHINHLLFSQPDCFLGSSQIQEKQRLLVAGKTDFLELVSHHREAFGSHSSLSDEWIGISFFKASKETGRHTFSRKQLVENEAS